MPSPPKQRRNGPQTKQRIVLAAQEAFAELGYSQAGVRNIAADAGVATSLPMQYFGSKANLFEEALLAGMNDNPEVLFDRRNYGERTVDMLMAGADIKLAAMVVLSTGDPQAREIAARVTRDQIVQRLAEWLGPPDARARAMNIIMLLTGFVVYARQLEVGPLDRRTLSWVKQTVQAIVDEGDGYNSHAKL